ncbi:dihydroorotase [Hydrotalea sandarakina]|jgi:dihydroorotase|uniref:Dihydroorotase n=1 Tax=Hydrotalea sandarakina TaxID=1004304 RepID=A0A2W7S3A3_9BACT|nr:dihydroorotase [Hydrotalea sandarakina]PZX61767.1 dihydroorotase [Hydrotalea sandarakina]
MKILLKQVTISDANSEFNGTTQDILIENGKITAIQPQLNIDADQIIHLPNAYVSQGWVDPFVHFCDPGFEYRETIESGAKAAASGGFTRVATLPNTKPIIQNKAQIEYITNTSNQYATIVHALGAISKNIEGKELAEMYEMHHAGALAFTDGLMPLQSSALMVKALQYIKAFNGIIIQIPEDTTITPHGLMNEGVVSTQMGLPGKPAVSETLMIARDIHLVEYTGSAIHFTGITTAASIQLIKEAKQKGLKVSCSVTPQHLWYCDEDLKNYDTNLKLTPPLRTKSDMLALREGLLNGVIDAITTHHTPVEVDKKVCEFEYAQPGMIGLQTAYSIINSIFKDTPEHIKTNWLGNNIRNIFNLPNAAIMPGNTAELTLYNNAETFSFSLQNNKSKSANTPFLNKPFTGKVYGIINKDKVFLNESSYHGS